MSLYLVTGPFFVVWRSLAGIWDLRWGLSVYSEMVSEAGPGCLHYLGGIHSPPKVIAYVCVGQVQSWWPEKCPRVSGSKCQL